MTALDPLERDLRFVVQLCREVPAGSTLVLRAEWDITESDVRDVVDTMEAAVPDTHVVVLGPGLSLEAVCPGEDGAEVGGPSSGESADTASDTRKVSS